MFQSKPHCKHGHEWTESNTYTFKNKRYCRACRTLRSKYSPKAKINRLKWREKNRDKERQQALTSLRKKKYNIEQKVVNQILIIQKNACAICQKEFLKTPFVDHCHTTGKVRGLLCSICNSGLGMFKDNETNLTQAIAYLRGVPKWRQILDNLELKYEDI